jgi:hypothetical protein
VSVLVPAALDASRYYYPLLAVLRWASRASKVAGAVLIVKARVTRPPDQKSRLVYPLMAWVRRRGSGPSAKVIVRLRRFGRRLEPRLQLSHPAAKPLNLRLDLHDVAGVDGMTVTDAIDPMK